MTLPFVVVEAGRDALADARADLDARGWRVVDAVVEGASGLVLAVTVADERQAAAALFVAIEHVGLLVDARPGRDVIDRLCDDLRRLGRLDHRVDGAGPFLTPDERALLDLLGDGHSLGAAADLLHVSRRSADRRLAAARDKLGAETTGQAVATYHRRLERLPRPD